jgi:hypothetical protein
MIASLRRSIRRFALISGAMALVGCAVATWGGSYHVLNETPDQIVIEYDRVLTNPALLKPLVDAHCAKHGRQPYMRDVSRTPGLGTVMFDCR